MIAWMERACGFALSAAVRAAGLAYLRREALLALVATATAVLVLVPAVPAVPAHGAGAAGRGDGRRVRRR